MAVVYGEFREAVRPVLGGPILTHTRDFLVSFRPVARLHCWLMPTTQPRPAATAPVKSPSNDVFDRDLAVRLAWGREPSCDDVATNRVPDDASFDELMGRTAHPR